MDRENRRVRLAETIAWCSLQPLNGSPEESDEIKHRRQLFKRSGKLFTAACALHCPKWLRWLTARKRERLRQEAMRQLAEADADSIEPLREQLRTELLRPRVEFLSPQTESDREAIVEELCEARVVQLCQIGQSPAIGDAELAGGRILMYAPDDNLSDGAAKYSSKGFFDVENVPPWDSWICFDGAHLVCWVPPALLDPADAGVKINPEQCIRWADKASVERMFGPLREGRLE